MRRAQDSNILRYKRRFETTRSGGEQRPWTLSRAGAAARVCFTISEVGNGTTPCNPRGSSITMIHCCPAFRTLSHIERSALTDSAGLLKTSCILAMCNSKGYEAMRSQLFDDFKYSAAAVRSRFSDFLKNSIRSIPDCFMSQMMNNLTSAVRSDGSAIFGEVRLVFFS